MLSELGYRYLYPYQRLVVHNVLAACGFFGEEEAREAPGDQIVILPTGAGKSLCFQVPALSLPGLSLAVFPLLALMKDQERRARERGIPCAVLRGGMSEEERRAILSDAREGRVKLIITNPETILFGASLAGLRTARVSHLVIDEAHCIADWGESFRPVYRELGALRSLLSPTVTTAFTATASPRILEAVRERLFPGRIPHLVAGNPDRPNIHYAVMPSICPERDLRGLLLPDQASGLPARPALVFVRSRHGAEALAAGLRRRLGETEIFFYHAGLERAEKEDVEAWFHASRDGVLCATCAYGMGVDKPDIRLVVHREGPPSIEAYLQEAGRAGRDSGPARAVLLAGGANRGALAPYAEGDGCRRAFLLSHLGVMDADCAGCDVCDGTRLREARGLREILACIRARKRRLSRTQASALLAGRENAASRRQGLLFDRHFASMRDWEPGEIEAALSLLCLSGDLHECRTPLWKGRLTVAGAFRKSRK